MWSPANGCTSRRTRAYASGSGRRIMLRYGRHERMTSSHVDAHAPSSTASWLLDSDPSIRWQVLRDLTDAPAQIVADERSRVASEGWGPRLLDQFAGFLPTTIRDHIPTSYFGALSIPLG